MFSENQINLGIGSKDEIENCKNRIENLMDMKVAGEFKNREDNYFSRKKNLESELSAFQLREQELKKERTDWNALIEDTFDFAQNALKAFKNGNIETRKIIFRSLGSNWTLKDKKLQANLNDWLLPLQKSQNSNSLISIRLEPTKKGIRLRKLDASNDRFQLWWGQPGSEKPSLSVHSCIYSSETPMHLQ
jgi:hypothetical protein